MTPTMMMLGGVLAFLSALAAIFFFFITLHEWRSSAPNVLVFDVSRACVFGFAWLAVGSLVAVMVPGAWGEWHGLAPVVIWIGWTLGGFMFCWSQFEAARGTHPLQRRQTEVQ